jgi:hypothetical protein
MSLILYFRNIVITVYHSHYLMIFQYTKPLYILSFKKLMVYKSHVIIFVYQSYSDFHYTRNYGILRPWHFSLFQEHMVYLGHGTLYYYFRILWYTKAMVISIHKLLLVWNITLGNMLS